MGIYKQKKRGMARHRVVREGERQYRRTAILDFILTLELMIMNSNSQRRESTWR